MLSSAGLKVALHRLRSLLCNVSMAPLFVSASVFAAAAEDVGSCQKEIRAAFSINMFFLCGKAGWGPTPRPLCFVLHVKT